jgi:hypothetical protein
MRNKLPLCLGDNVAKLASLERMFDEEVERRISV